MAYSSTFRLTQCVKVHMPEHAFIPNGRFFFFPKLEMQDLTILCLSNTKKLMLPLCTTGDQICNALFKTKALPVWWGVASGLGRRQQGLLFFRIHNQLYVIEIQIPQKVY